MKKDSLDLNSGLSFLHFVLNSIPAMLAGNARPYEPKSVLTKASTHGTGKPVPYRLRRSI